MLLLLQQWQQLLGTHVEVGNTHIDMNSVKRGRKNATTAAAAAATINVLLIIRTNFSIKTADICWIWYASGWRSFFCASSTSISIFCFSNRNYLFGFGGLWFCKFNVRFSMSNFGRENTQRVTEARISRKKEEEEDEKKNAAAHNAPTDTCNAILVVKNLESTVLILLYKNAVDVVVVRCCCHCCTRLLL